MNANAITGKRYVDHLREAGFEVQPPVANQGRGAAMMRVEALRRLFPKLWFNEATTGAGRDALGYYHERRDDDAMWASGRSTTGPLTLRTPWA